jgi:hypothetical protein
MEARMTLCPVALVVHCKGCPIVKVCPAKSVIGDFEKEESPAPAEKGEAESEDSD